MGNTNSSQNKAKKAKNDEFYTLYEDVQREVEYYSSSLVGKRIYCPCDNPAHSNFYKFFKDNFHKLQLKELIATYYNPDISPLDSFIDAESKNPTLTVYDGIKETITPLKGNRGLSIRRVSRNPQESGHHHNKSPFQLV